MLHEHTNQETPANLRQIDSPEAGEGHLESLRDAWAYTEQIQKVGGFPESSRVNIGLLATENRRDAFELRVKAAINSSVALVTRGLQVLPRNQDTLYGWANLCIVLQARFHHAEGVTIALLWTVCLLTGFFFIV